MDRVKLLLRCQAGKVGLIVACVDHILKRRNPHHEKLIHIGRGDRQKFHPV